MDRVDPRFAPLTKKKIKWIVAVSGVNEEGVASKRRKCRR